MRRKFLGPDDLKLAASQDQLGFLLTFHLEQPEETEPLLREALRIRRKQLGPEHRLVAESLRNLGMMFTKRGDFRDAGPVLEESVSISRKVMAPDDPELINVVQDLAGYYGFFVLDTERAEALEREVVELSEKILGKDHPGTAEHLFSLGSLLSRKGEFEQAQTLVRQALETHQDAETKLGAWSTRNAIYLQMLGVMKWSSGEDTEAREFFFKYLEIKRDTTENPLSLMPIDFLQTTGHLTEPEKVAREVVSMRRRARTTGFGLATALYRLGEVLQKQGKLEEARPLFSEAAETQKQVLDGLRQRQSWRHPTIMASYQAVLGGSLKGLRQFGEAEPLLLKSNSAYQAYYDVRHARAQVALRRVSNCTKLGGSRTKPKSIE